MTLDRDGADPVRVPRRAAHRRAVDRARALGHRLRRDAIRRRQHPGRQRARHRGVGQQRLVVARRPAAVHLDGRDPVPHPPLGGDVPRLRALAQPAAGRAHARQRGGLRRVRLGVGLVRRHHRHGRQDRAAGAQEARLRRDAGARLARRRRHARHPDPAVDHDGDLCGAGQRVDHPGVSRRLPAGPPGDGALFRLHRAVVAAASRADAAARSADAVAGEDRRIAQPGPVPAAHCVRVPVAPARLGDRDRMRGLGRARLARHRLVAGRADAGRRSGKA